MKKARILQIGRVTLVSTPIGRAADMTLYGLDVLRNADVLLAEDTRVLRKLLDLHGIALNGRKLLAYHDHNRAKMAASLEAALNAGQWLAYSSDAGTPIISDPGESLVALAREVNAKVEVAPGASAVMAAICLAEQASAPFFFGGFLPNKAKARQQELTLFVSRQMTGVYFESPKRLCATLADVITVCGPDQPLTVCRELTKKFQEVVPGSAADLLKNFSARDAIKGEIVLVLGPKPKVAVDEGEIKQNLADLLKDHPVKAAATLIAQRYDISRKQAYSWALDLKQDE